MINLDLEEQTEQSHLPLKTTKMERNLDLTVPQIKVAWEAPKSAISPKEQMYQEKSKKKGEQLGKIQHDQNGSSFTGIAQHRIPGFNTEVSNNPNGSVSHPMRWQQQTQLDPFFTPSPFLPQIPSPILVYPFRQLGSLSITNFSTSGPFLGKQTSPPNPRRPVSENILKSATTVPNPLSSVSVKNFPQEETRTNWSAPQNSIPEPPSISLAEYQQSQLEKQSKQSHLQKSSQPHPKPIQRPLNPNLTSTFTSPPDLNAEISIPKKNGSEVKISPKTRDVKPTWNVSKREPSQHSREMNRSSKKREKLASHNKMVYVPKSNQPNTNA